MQSGQALNRTFYFNNATRVLLDPQNASAQAVESYIQITSPQHSWSREGATESGPFMTALADDPSSLYDVLVVPLGAGVAPALFPSRTAPRVAALAVVLDPGIPVSGTLSVDGGPAVPGATVVLRADMLPSTVGTSDAAGAFSLLARPGRFSAAIVPAPGDTRPEAHVDADLASGIDLSSATSYTLKLAWKSGLGASTLAVHFAGASGPAAAMTVRLDSDDASLTDVGTLSVTDGSGTAQTFTARGAIHRTATTDAAGSVSFAGLPSATYQLTAIPPSGAAEGVTITPVDLTSGAAPAPETVNLTARVRVNGTLTNAPPGTRVIVLDDRPVAVPGYGLPTALVAGNGAFTLSLDAQRAYHLVAYPPDSQMTSRVPLGGVTTTTPPSALDGAAFPKMLPVSGKVMDGSGTTGVANAQVQLFCIGAGPDCVDPSQPASKDPAPLIEGVTDSSGAFALVVPDPGPP